MEHAVWLATQGTKKPGNVSREGRGRAGGLYERADPGDRQEWNSDEEELDDFGRKKKRRTGPKSEKPSGSAKASADEARGSRMEDIHEKGRSRQHLAPASSSSAPAADFPVDFPVHPAMMAASMAMAPATTMSALATALSAPANAAQDAAMQILLQKMPKEAAAEALKRVTPSQTQLLTERQSRGGKQFVPPKPITGALVKCRHFAQGFCTWGNRCTFIHDPMDQLNKMQGFIDFETGLPKEEAKKQIHPQESNDKVNVSSSGTIYLKTVDTGPFGAAPGQQNASTPTMAMPSNGFNSVPAKSAMPMGRPANSVPAQATAPMAGVSNLPAAFRKRLKAKV